MDLDSVICDQLQETIDATSDMLIGSNGFLQKVSSTVFTD